MSFVRRVGIALCALSRSSVDWLWSLGRRLIVVACAPVRALFNGLRFFMKRLGAAICALSKAFFDWLRSTLLYRKTVEWSKWFGTAIYALGKAFLDWLRNTRTYKRFVAWVKQGDPRVEKTIFPVSKIALVIWVLIATAMFVEMWRVDINLPWNVVRMSTMTFVTIYVFKLYKLLTKQGLGIRLKEKTDFWTYFSLALFSMALSMGFFYSAYTSGDWTVAQVYASSCLGSFHIHHVDWSLFCFILLLLGIIFGRKYSKTVSYGAFAASVLFGILVAILFATHGWFPQESGLWRSFGALTFVFFSVGMAFRYDRTTSRWVLLLMSVYMGVAIGIFIQGVVFGIQTLPGSMINFNSEGCMYPLPTPGELIPHK